jgi:pyridoxamine 5'-phosphate oxidase-like protein
VWSEAEDQILGGDLAVALAYVTPAGGAVVTPVSPVGLRDRDAQTVAFTTSLGFGRKLDRIRANPRVALAYHAREHGFASEPRFVLVQGTASYDPNPDLGVLEERVRPASTRFMGPPRTGFFWGRWLSVYYEDRILVTVGVERVISWPDLECSGEPSVFGEPLPAAQPESQAPPANGTAPRVDVNRAARRIEKLPHVVLGYVAADGFPLVTPVSLQGATPSGLALQGSLPPGGRRAGLLAHRFEAKLIGLEARQYTGWLQDGVYAPHTESGFRAPANKTLLLLANGMLARRGLKHARELGRA